MLTKLLQFLLLTPLATSFVIPGKAFTPSKRDTSAALTGQATFYGGNVNGGACSFSTYTLPSNIFGTALSSSNWDNSAECGACVEVKGPSGSSIVAMIVDECPGCGSNHLDLFPTAFTSLAPASEGIIPITWTYTPCPITSPLELVNKEGVSAFWFSMQVVNANLPVVSLEVSTDGGNTWQETQRATYNFFENQSGFGTDVVDVRVTSSQGDVVVVKDVEVVSGGSVTASGNFAGAGASGSVAASSAAPSVVVAAVSSSTTPVVAQVTSAEAASTSVAAAVPTTPIIVSSATSAEPVGVSTVMVVPVAASTSSDAALATETSTLSSKSGSSKTTSVIWVTVTASRAGATGTNDVCDA